MLSLDRPITADPVVPAGDGFRLAGKEEPEARKTENRGRLWLVLSYVVCPCHLPVTMAVVSTAAGGTALGAALTANALRFGAVVTVIYGLVLWRAFHHLRTARALAADGLLVCGPTSCERPPDPPPPS